MYQGWGWPDDTPVTYTDWSDKTGGSCGYMDGNNGFQWMGASCSDSHLAVCSIGMCAHNFVISKIQNSIGSD